MIDNSVKINRNSGNGANGHPIFSFAQRHALALRIADVDGVTYEEAHQNIRELLDADLREYPTGELAWRSDAGLETDLAVLSDLARAKLKRRR